jgi:hypothetical protein
VGNLYLADARALIDFRTKGPAFPCRPRHLIEEGAREPAVTTSDAIIGRY